jgi:hypothetical protein
MTSYRTTRLTSRFISSLLKIHKLYTGTAAGGTEQTGAGTATAATTGDAANVAARRHTAAVTALVAKRERGAAPSAKNDAASQALTNPAGAAAPRQTATAGGISAQHLRGPERSERRRLETSGTSKTSTNCGTLTSGRRSCRP